MPIDLNPQKTFKENYIKKHGENEWIKLTGHYIDFRNHSTLKYVVESLIELRNIGFKSYYTNFNGVDLFVRDVTLESALMKLHNIKKEELVEFLNKQKKTLEDISTDKKHILKKKI